MPVDYSITLSEHYIGTLHYTSTLHQYIKLYITPLQLHPHNWLQDITPVHYSVQYSSTWYYFRSQCHTTADLAPLPRPSAVLRRHVRLAASGDGVREGTRTDTAQTVHSLRSAGRSLYQCLFWPNCIVMSVVDRCCDIFFTFC